MKKADWRIFQDYIAEKLKDIDPNARSTKGSGNQGELGDVNNSVDLCIECKQRNTKSVTIKEDTWEKLCNEIPLHSERTPVLALENKDKKRWAVLDLDDFLDLYIELHSLRENKDYTYNRS